MCAQQAGICRAKADFDKLLSNYGNKNDDKAKYEALIPNGGSGFSALLGGFSDGEGGYSQLGEFVNFWSSSTEHIKSPSALGVYGNPKGAFIVNVPDSWGFSVRCIKD